MRYNKNQQATGDKDQLTNLQVGRAVRLLWLSMQVSFCDNTETNKWERPWIGW